MVLVIIFQLSPSKGIVYKFNKSLPKVAKFIDLSNDYSPICSCFRDKEKKSIFAIVLVIAVDFSLFSDIYMLMRINSTIENYFSPFIADNLGFFSVKIRDPGGEWRNVSLCNARIGLRHTGTVSIASFDFSGKIEICVNFRDKIESVKIRPFRHKITCSQDGDKRIYFILENPAKLSVEINGDSFNNLHIFANSAADNIPEQGSGKLISYPPGIHRIGGDGFLKLQSGQTLHLPYGAILKTKGIVCDHVEDVRISGRGIVDMSDHMPDWPGNNERPDTRGVCATFAKNISIDGIMFLNPNHYSIYLGQSDGVKIRNIKSFSSSIWADGIDCMSTTNLEADDIFLRTSDDCIAIYGHRWDYYGDTRNIAVKNSVLWADVAHPIMIGVHGLHEKDGDIVENIFIDNIDILLHDEIIEQYQGALAINSGDANIVRHVTFSNIRIEEIREGQILNIRVFKNESYNPKPGRCIEDIMIKNVSYSGSDRASEICGYDEERRVERVTIENLTVNGTLVTKAEDAGIRIGNFVNGVVFKK